MPDLNDFVLFAEIVSHGGFAAAGRALGEPKSKLSRRLAGLEARLGVRLIERSTRRFRVTELGGALYERCRTLVLDLEQAEAVVASALAEPQGRVRISCATASFEPLIAALPSFLAAYPKVKMQLIGTDLPVDLIAERIDLALRVATLAFPGENALTIRQLGRSRRVLIASPAMAARIGSLAVAALPTLPTLGVTDDADQAVWELFGPQDDRQTIRHEPRLSCANYRALREAALGGIGIGLLPDFFIREDLAEGRLVQVFDGWHAGEGVLQLAFTTRRGLPPAVRALIDHLVAGFGQRG